MPIDKTTEVDFIGVDKASDNVILTISDHLDWGNELNHLALLQEKINTYIAFIESGQIADDYPNGIGKKIIIEIVSKYEYPPIGLEFLNKAIRITDNIDIELRQRVLKT